MNTTLAADVKDVGISGGEAASCAVSNNNTIATVDLLSNTAEKANFAETDYDIPSVAEGEATTTPAGQDGVESRQTTVVGDEIVDSDIVSVAGDTAADMMDLDSDGIDKQTCAASLITVVTAQCPVCNMYVRENLGECPKCQYPLKVKKKRRFTKKHTWQLPAAFVGAMLLCMLPGAIYATYRQIAKTDQLVIGEHQERLDNDGLLCVIKSIGKWSGWSEPRTNESSCDRGNGTVRQIRTRWRPIVGYGDAPVCPHTNESAMFSELPCPDVVDH